MFAILKGWLYYWHIKAKQGGHDMTVENTSEMNDKNSSLANCLEQTRHLLLSISAELNAVAMNRECGESRAQAARISEVLKLNA